MNILVQIKQAETTSFGSDTEKFKKKCEAYGLKFGSGEFAQCMIQLEQGASHANQREADRLTLERAREADRISQENIQRNANTPSAIDWFRLANEFAKPPQFGPAPCNGGMLAPVGQATNCR